MKKLLSLALTIAVGVGSTGLQAANTMEKAWAYTKITLGGVSLAAGCWMPCYAAKTFVGMDERWTAEKGGEVDVKQAYAAGQKKVLVLGGAGSSVALLPLGILLIKDGRRDLRRLGKRVAQEDNKTATDDKEVPLELSE